MGGVATSIVTLYSHSYYSSLAFGRGPLGIDPSSALRPLGNHVPLPPVGALPAPNQASGSPGRPVWCGCPLATDRGSGSHLDTHTHTTHTHTRFCSTCIAVNGMYNTLYHSVGNKQKSVRMLVQDMLGLYAYILCNAYVGCKESRCGTV